MIMRKLIFVYNAGSGLFNSLGDSVHKLVSPETYECNLCRLTYGLTSMRDEWREFVESLDMKVEFLHKDEVLDEMKGKELPAVFLDDGKVRLLVSAKELNKAKSIDDLKEIIRKKI